MNALGAVTYEKYIADGAVIQLNSKTAVWNWNALYVCLCQCHGVYSVICDMFFHIWQRLNDRAFLFALILPLNFHFIFRTVIIYHTAIFFQSFSLFSIPLLLLWLLLLYVCRCVYCNFSQFKYHSYSNHWIWHLLLFFRLSLPNRIYLRLVNVFSYLLTS